MNGADPSIYCSAAECGGYATSESRLCQKCRNRLSGLIGAVPNLIGFIRYNRIPGQRTSDDRITGSRERPSPVNLSAVVDADDMYAISATWAATITDERHLDATLISALRGWRIGGVIVGLAVQQNVDDAIWCSKLIQRHYDWVLHQDWVGALADEYNEIVGPVRARWSLSERARWLPCPYCDQLTMSRYAPTFAGGPVTYSCVSAECGQISIEENDFLGRAHQRIQQDVREKELA